MSRNNSSSCVFCGVTKQLEQCIDQSFFGVYDDGRSDNYLQPLAEKFFAKDKHFLVGVHALASAATCACFARSACSARSARYVAPLDPSFGWSILIIVANLARYSLALASVQAWISTS